MQTPTISVLVNSSFVFVRCITPLSTICPKRCELSRQFCICTLRDSSQRLGQIVERGVIQRTNTKLSGQFTTLRSNRRKRRNTTYKYKTVRCITPLSTICPKRCELSRQFCICTLYYASFYDLP
jgi:hypothetical protein